MSEIEVVAIQGLDAAIIGTAERDGIEVLAYDYDKAFLLVVQEGYSEESAEKYLAKMMATVFEGSPVFIYLDNDQEFYGSSTPAGTIVH